MMEYADFKEQVQDRILDFLSEEFADAHVKVREIIKNNDTVLDGLSVMTDSVHISPTIYLNNYFDSYMGGEDMDGILSKMATSFMDNYVDHDLDMSNLLNLNNALDKITCKLINLEDNTQFLQDKPHTKMDDLAVVYQVVVNRDDTGTASITITDTIAAFSGMTADELHKIAMENMGTLHGPTIKGMNDVIVEMFAMDLAVTNDLSMEEAKAMAQAMLENGEGTDNMLIVSNSNRVDGAAVILNDDIRQEIAGRIGGDFYILPSSIHETIIVPKADIADYRELQDMVQNINSEQVKPEERLSNHVYEYDAKSHEMFRSDKAPEREKAKAKEKDNEKEKPSLKGKLAEKQNEIKAKEPQKEGMNAQRKKEAAL